jgi:hypothetical protein
MKAFHFATVAALALLSGCSTLPSGSATRAASHVGTTSYADSLAACRFFRGGRPGASRERAADDPPIEDCLRRRGWTADGNPTLDQLLGHPSGHPQ